MRQYSKEVLEYELFGSGTSGYGVTDWVVHGLREDVICFNEEDADQILLALVMADLMQKLGLTPDLDKLTSAVYSEEL